MHDYLCLRWIKCLKIFEQYQLGKIKYPISTKDHPFTDGIKKELRWSHLSIRNSSIVVNILENKANEEYLLSKENIEEWKRVGDMKSASFGLSSDMIDSRLAYWPENAFSFPKISLNEALKESNEKAPIFEWQLSKEKFHSFNVFLIYHARLTKCSKWKFLSLF